jgi:colanic acid/amylovoran biosynthesis glycosyltransferase
VLPSVVAAAGDEENQPVALAEAQACGIPVVASRIGGIPESMKDGESGILVPAGDVDALAGAIVKLAADPGRWPRMGHMGRELIEEQFDVDKLNRKLEQTYLRVMDSYRSNRASPNRV